MYGHKAYPYPQIVTNEEWEVYETTDRDPSPRTDNLNRKMYVPLDRECNKCGVNHSKYIRRHELGHAKWSPKTIGKLRPGVRQDAIEVLEEVRINYLLAKYGLPVDEYIECEDMFNMKFMDIIYNKSIADVILFGIASQAYVRDTYMQQTEQANAIEKIIYAVVDNANDISPLRKAELSFAINQIKGFANKITYSRAGQNPSYRKVQKLAKDLSEILDMFTELPEPYKEPTPQPGEGEESDEESESDETVNGDVNDLERRMREKLLEDMSYMSGRGVGYWGKMTIHEPPLTVNLQARLKGSRAYRPMDYGYNPKYINRYCIDKKIFKQKQNVKGGTILIDASGSMRFNGDDILEIMNMLPAVNIAMYNGYTSDGDLRIIAKNGKRVDDNYLDKHSGGGNVVDGPALEWLATMPARRIWVSDMKVFGGSGDTAGANLLRDCYNICTKNKIINLKDIEEVKEYALKLNQVL
mgnify:FL=1